MNKADLKKSWSKYCDTDKLVDDVMALLKKYKHRNSEHGVCTMLNTFFTNKKELIDMLATSEHYNGDMRIVLDVELERTNSKYDIQKCCRNFLADINARDAIVKNTDENGKTLNDYIKVGVKAFCAKDLLNENFKNTLTTNADNRNKFDLKTGEINESVNTYINLGNLFLNGFGYNIFSTLNQSTIDVALRLNIPVDLVKGMKTSRAFNKVCVSYGIDQLPNYNKKFAEYADLVSGHKRNMKFFISVNPLDYLTMSFGNSWTSCHSIINHGGWCGGCVSYMLDNSSIITYVHSEMPNSIEDGKVYRNMFHYHNGALLQARIYPQANDGATDLYEVFRDIVRNEISSLIGVSKDSWTTRKGNYLYNVETTGVHYTDYNNYSRYNFSYTTEIDGAKDSIISIGHQRICAYCGEETDDFPKNTLSHNNCTI